MIISIHKTKLFLTVVLALSNFNSTASIPQQPLTNTKPSTTVLLQLLEWGEKIPSARILVCAELQCLHADKERGKVTAKSLSISLNQVLTAMGNVFAFNTLRGSSVDQNKSQALM